MKYGKYLFKDLKEFITIQPQAKEKGFETIEDFEKFLELNCSDKKIDK